MHLTEGLALAIAAAAGGAINAVAGGGTLVTFPTLLFFGTAPITANATSTVALVIGTSGSIFGYRQHLAAVKPWLIRFTPVSLLGGLIGAILLTFTSNEVFAKLVPFLILFATVLFLLQGAAKTLALKESTGAGSNRWNAPIIIFQLGVAIYGGYFGAGIGILMLAALGFIGLKDIYQMNTVKTFLGSAINAVAALWFVASGMVDWPRAIVMTIGAVSGYYLGAHYSQRIAPQRVRQIITAIGFTLAAVTFYQEFIGRK